MLTGRMLISHDKLPEWRIFRLELRGIKLEDVIEKVYSELGSRHKLRRKHIKIEKRNLIIYLVPWIAFSLINVTTAKIITFYALNYVTPLFLILQIVIGALGALVGGAISDFIGRKKILAFALTLFGISSVLSVFVNISTLANFMFINTGFTWGMLSTLYLFVIWGDLADKKTNSYTYSIGLATFFATTGLGALLTPEIQKISFFTASIINCLVVFISNIFIILAPEILPSDIREKNYIRLYMYLIKRKKRSLHQG